MPEPAGECRLRIGPSGWSYPDWKGVVYPAAQASRFDALRFLSGYFEAIEINSSFYRPPATKTTQSWARRVADRPNFRFAMKLWQRFTHERPAPQGDVAPAPNAADVDQVRRGMDPLAESGVLGCVLMQFPWSFQNEPQSMDWLSSLANRFAAYPLAVELRHSSWDAPEARARIQDMGVNYCNIDQPRLNRCLLPSDHVTGPVGYVRFHGRRHDTWFAQNAQAGARYDYLYREDELREWVSRIDTIAERTDSLYVFTNNHFRGQGPANAMQLRAMFEQGDIDVPSDLVPHFPFLSAPPFKSPPQERTLFDA